MLGYNQNAHPLCSKVPGSKPCSCVVGKEPPRWGGQPQGQTMRVNHVNSLRLGLSSGNGLPTGPDLGASPEVRPQNPRAALD